MPLNWVRVKLQGRASGLGGQLFIGAALLKMSHVIMIARASLLAELRGEGRSSITAECFGDVL